MQQVFGTAVSYGGITTELILIMVVVWHGGLFSFPTKISFYGLVVMLHPTGWVLVTQTGGLRDIPLNDESTNASYTLVASDAGKVVHVHSHNSTVVVPNSVFSVGNVVTILNGGTTNITVNQGSGFALKY